MKSGNIANSLEKFVKENRDRMVAGGRCGG